MGISVIKKRNKQYYIDCKRRHRKHKKNRHVEGLPLILRDEIVDDK